jgi:type IV secretion system protein VirB5
MVKYFAGLFMALTLWASPQQAHAGIPTVSLMELVQSIVNTLTEVTEAKAQYDQLVGQLKQAEKQYESLTGMRNLGDALNNPRFQSYLPKDATNAIRLVNSGGYQNLTGSAKALRNAAKVYGCEEEDGAAQTRCQRDLNLPYQYQAYYQEADERAKDRVEQINSLMELASSTEDPKAIAEVQARIAGEVALLEHEHSRISLIRGMADADEQVTRARGQERKRARAARTGKLGGSGA